MWPDYPGFLSDATRVAPRGLPRPMIGPARTGAINLPPPGPAQRVYNAAADFVPGASELRALKEAWRNPSLSTLGGVALAAVPLARPVARGIRFLEEVPITGLDDMAGQRIVSYDTPKGEAWVHYKRAEDGSLDILNVGSQGGAGSLGPRIVAELRDDIAKRTGADAMAGIRVSGSAFGREASIKVKRQDPLSEAKQTLQAGDDPARTETLPFFESILRRLSRDQ